MKTCFEGGPLDGQSLDIGKGCHRYNHHEHFEYSKAGDRLFVTVRTPRALIHSYYPSREWEGVQIFIYNGCTAEY